MISAAEADCQVWGTPVPDTLRRADTVPVFRGEQSKRGQAREWVIGLTVAVVHRPG
jgi:hypothetical protein